MNNIPKGYKQTEVGVIPEDWEVHELGTIICSMQLGGNYPNTEKETLNPLIKMGNLGRGNIVLDKLEYITNIITPSEKDKLNLGDILFNTRNTLDLVGKIAIWQNELSIAYFNSNILRLKFDSNLVSSNHFMNFVLNTKLVLIQLRGIATGTTSVAAIYTRDLAKIRVPLPTLAEQTAIANALSDTDALIQSLEKLIAKKRAIKQGAMQQLLTGKKRLPGFGNKTKKYKQTELGLIPEDWKSCRFEDVLTGFSSGMTPYRGRPEYYKGDIPWITSGELDYNVVTDTEEKITKEAVIKTSLKILPKETFLIAITGLEAEGTRGSCGIVGVEATTNQSCMALFPIKNEITLEYLYHFYVLYGNELAFKYCQGTKQQSYTGRIAKVLPINLPPTITEQTRIASILSDMDAEIAAMENKLAKYKQIKQGMMQTLLTGRIRLV
ncbi:MAG: restriction endonuclease subunit S [Firmicutes bacterium HGW-Firmicutes-14]|nr:MAG: restriction endonuclease subunit S [Firmicutes bacterium HGW-Firmicutes-14]